MIVSKDMKTKGKDGRIIRNNLGLKLKDSKKKPNMFKCYCSLGLGPTDTDFSNDIDMTDWDTSEAQKISFKEAA